MKRTGLFKTYLELISFLGYSFLGYGALLSGSLMAEMMARMSDADRSQKSLMKKKIDREGITALGFDRILSMHFHALMSYVLIGM